MTDVNCVDRDCPSHKASPEYWWNGISWYRAATRFDKPTMETVTLSDTRLRNPNGDLRRIYVSGPMTGIEDHNFPAFNAEAERLRSLGWTVYNPAENAEMDTPEEYLRYDIELMLKCDAVYFLDGWQNSAGARAEYAVAKAIGLEILNEDHEEPVELEAQRIVRNGERQQNYGHPNQDFARTAGIWTALLGHKLKDGEQVTMQDMALMMVGLKQSRLQSTPGHHDSLVDLIGYAICYDRLGES